MIRSTYAARPAAGTDGRLWLATDSPFMAYDDGAAWHEYYGSTPVFATNGFPSTWVNQGIATADLSKGGVVLANAAAAGANLRLLVKPVPAAPYTIILGMLPQFVDADYVSGGIVLRDSAGGGIITAGPRTGSTMYVDKWSSPTAFSGNYTSMPVANLPRSMIWLKLEDDNTNRKLSVSYHGLKFQLVHTVGRTDFITPNQVGIYIQAQNATWDASAWFPSWQES